MSTKACPGQGPSLNPPQPDHPEQDNLAGTLPADLPPDPLLDSGSFIDANGLTNGEVLIKRESNRNHQSAELQRVCQSSTGAPPTSAAEALNGAEPETSVPAKENTDARPKPRRSQGAEPAVATETPNWLPPGWFILDRVRSSGATAGMVDKYYVDPASGRRFRSKKEVLYFLETGTPRKRKRVVENSNVDTDPLESSGGNKQKKSGTGMKNPALKFDFLNVPEKIKWVLTDTSESEESWIPFIGDEKVSESSRHEWAAAFTSLAAKNANRKMF